MKSSSKKKCWRHISVKMQTRERRRSLFDKSRSTITFQTKNVMPFFRNKVLYFAIKIEIGYCNQWPKYFTKNAKCSNFFCHRISTSNFRNFGIAAIQFPQRDKLTHQHKCKITLQSVVHAHDQFILHEPQTRKFYEKLQNFERNVQFFINFCKCYSP